MTKLSVVAREQRYSLLIAAAFVLLMGCQTQGGMAEDHQPTAEFSRKQSGQMTETLPSPVGWVNDFADVISPEYEEKITSRIKAVKSNTGAEIVVLTVQTFTPYATIDEFSLTVANEWGVGSSERNDGVLITVAMKERRVRIEVGHGLEGTITNNIAGQILDEDVIPHLTKGEYGIGLLAAVDAIAKIIDPGGLR